MNKRKSRYIQALLSFVIGYEISDDKLTLSQKGSQYDNVIVAEDDGVDW